MKLNIKPAILLISAFSLVEMGCLKDEAYDNGEIQSTRLRGALIKPIEIKLTAASVKNFKTYSFAQSDNDTTLDLIPVNLATADPAPEDINVTLIADPAAVDAYNTANGTAYAVPGDAMLSVVNPGGVVTIKKGEHTAYLQVKFRINDFLGAAWAVAYTISSVDKPEYTISGNMETGITSLVIKNPYDGDYTVTGYFNHPSGPRPISMTKTLSTVSAVTSEADLGDLGAADYHFAFDVDQATNDLTNWAAVGATPAPPASGFIDPGPGNDNAAGNPNFPTGDFLSTDYNNTYDPATHTFMMHYGYSGAAPAFTREIYEKWVLE